MPSTRYKQLGLTILEILIALAIGGILLGLAAPSLQSVLGDSEMSATSNELVYSLQTARSEAIKRAARVGLCPSSDALSADPTCSGGYVDGWIVFVDTDGNGTREATNEVLMQSEARSPAFAIEPDSVFSDRVYFDISGSSINTAGVPLSGAIRLTYQAGNQQREVSIGASGRIATSAVEYASSDTDDNDAGDDAGDGLGNDASDNT